MFLPWFEISFSMLLSFNRLLNLSSPYHVADSGLLINPYSHSSEKNRCNLSVSVFIILLSQLLNNPIIKNKNKK